MRIHRLLYRLGTWLYWRGGMTPAETRDLTIEGAAGPIAARLYGSGLGGAKPLILFFHGGGFCIGDLYTHDPICRDLAAETGAAVLAVDYRLAPEHPYPAAPADACAAYRWVQAHAAEIGVDATQIIVAGDSAGGNLAAVVALHARDAGDAALIGQVLIYPGLNDFIHGGAIDRAAAVPSVLTPKLMTRFFRHYFPGGRRSDEPDAAPLLAPSHAGVAPALITVCGKDPLRPDGEAYADALRATGVAADLVAYPALDHGFLSVGGRSRDYTHGIDDISRWVRARLARR